MALKKSPDLRTPEQKANDTAIREEKRRVERELVYGEREILSFLSNAMLAVLHRQGWKPIKPERLQVLTRCAGILIDEMKQLADEKILLREEAIVIWLAAALRLECIDIQGRDNLPFGRFDLRG